MFGVIFTAFVACADHSKYRTCQQSKFCTRDRTVPAQNWTVDPSSLSTPSPSLFEATIEDGAYKTQLKLRISFLECGAARIRIEPLTKEPFNRFDVANEPTVIIQNVITLLQNFEMKKGTDSVILKRDNQQLEVQYAPFRVIVSDENGKRMTLNPEDTAIFETQRDRETWPDLFESMNWGGHDDKFKNGPTSVAMDVEFHADDVRMTGLPSHTLPVTLSQTIDGDPIRLFNTDINSYELNSVMSMYGAIPFVMAHAPSGCDGVFWCNPSETWADVITNGTNKIRFMSEGGYIDVFVFSGEPKDIVSTFTALTGRPQLVPYWALAFHQCRWGYMTAKEVSEVSEGLDQLLVPHDVLWLDLDHIDDRKYFTFHPTNFKDPLKLLDDLDHSKRKLVVLVDPHLKAEHSYYVYSEATKGGLVIKNNNGDGDFVGNCWPGRSSWPDYLNPATREWWETQYSFKKFKQSRPNLFIWNDMNEIAVFDSCDLTAPRDLVHYGDIEEREVHNIYGNLMVSATFGGLVKRDKDQNQRPFILTRSFFAGTQRYAAVWSGDNAADWNHLRCSVQMVLTYGLSGQVYSGADVGGFFESPDDKLLARWYQVGAWMYPFFRCHCHHLSKYREVYKIEDPEFRDVAREAIVDRYKLLPYWYTLSQQANMTGEPIVRPMWWEFAGAEWLDVDDKAMIGSGLLVAPIWNESAESATIALPTGTRWYCFRTLAEVKQNPVEVPVNGGRTPVFLRGGTIIPSKRRIRKSSTLMFWDPFTLTIGVNEEGRAEGDLYVDDGETFDFARGQFIRKRYIFDGRKLTACDYNFRDPMRPFADKYDVVVEQIRIAGLEKAPTKIIDHMNNELRFDFDGGVLTIHRPQLHVRDNFAVTLEY